MQHREKKQVSNLELIDCTRVSEILRIREWVQKCGRCREWEANKTGPQTTNWLGGLESEGWKWKVERWQTERFRQKVECCSLPKLLLGVGVAAYFSSSPLFTFSLRACGREVAAISAPAQRGEKPSVPWVSEGENGGWCRCSCSYSYSFQASQMSDHSVTQCLLHSVLRASPLLLTLTTFWCTNAYTVCVCVCASR